MFEGSRVIHEGSHCVTDGRVPGIARLSCNTEVSEPEPGNCNCLQSQVIFKGVAQMFGMKIKGSIDENKQDENN